MLASAGLPLYLQQVVVSLASFYHRLKRLNTGKAVCSLLHFVSERVTHRTADKDGTTRL